MKWSGSTEKKWEWYKHTKPCYNMIYMGSCADAKCNYAHTVDQYVDAIQKRKFKIDFNIVNQLKKVDIYLNLMKVAAKIQNAKGEDISMDSESSERSVKRRRTDY